MARNRERVFHIVGGDVWSALRPDGVYEPESLTREGFVHLSYADQVLATADRFYRDLAKPVVVELTRSALPGPVVDEDSAGSGQEFPHLYGAVPAAAAVAIHPLVRTTHGGFCWDVTDA